MRILLVAALLCSKGFAQLGTAGLKERVAQAPIILTGKLLSVVCVDSNKSVIEPEGNCTGDEKNNKLKYRVRVKKVLKGRANYLRRNNLRQKVFYYLDPKESKKADIASGGEHIFFFQNRKLVPALMDGTNHIELSKLKEVESLISKD